MSELERYDVCLLGALQEVNSHGQDLAVSL